MYATRKQRTIASSALVEGVGYWSGLDVCVEFRPAAADAGVTFVRADLPGQPRIPALAEHRVEIPRRTSLTCGGASVEMVEHIMAALSGMRIDNCEVWVNQTEMPGCDGSALPFVKVLDAAGVVVQSSDRQVRFIKEPLRLGTPDCWVEARPCRSGRTVLQYELDYGLGNAIGRQSLEISLSPRFFHMNLAPSRTFLLESEAAALQAKGLGQRATCNDLLVFGKDGPIGNELRFPDECVRHKLVDLLGDLALAGCDLVGRFMACRSGHRLNAELVRTIMEEDQSQREMKRCA